MRFGLRVVLAGLLTGPGHAQADIDCDAAQAQVELTYCAEQAWRAADDALNAAYGSARRVMQQIDAELAQDQRGAEAALRDGQRAWIAFRDGTCAAEGYVFHGGSAEPMVIYACRERLTLARADDLTALAEPY